MLGSLKNLRHLSLASNRLSDLPIDIWKQRDLISLDLSNNQLIDIPEESAELINLQVPLLEQASIDKCSTIFARSVAL